MLRKGLLESALKVYAWVKGPTSYKASCWCNDDVNAANQEKTKLDKALKSGGRREYLAAKCKAKKVLSEEKRHRKL